MSQLPPLPADHPAKAEVDQLFSKLMVYNESDYRALSRRDRYVWDVWWMDTSLMSGGRDSWFTLMGHHATETLEALQAIDAPNAYREIERVCELFSDLPRDAENQLVQQKYDEFFKRHGRIDQYLDSQDTERGTSDQPAEYDLFQRLLDYWRRSDPDAK